MFTTDNDLTLNKPSRCEAILYCFSRLEDFGGDGRCAAKATYEFQGRKVCWVHKQACHGPRANSRNPVRFVEPRKASA